MEVAAIAERILHRIPDRLHWAKNAEEKQNERYCVLGAARREGLLMAPGWDKFQTAFIAKANEACPRKRGKWFNIPQINDSSLIRYEHIRVILEKLRAG